MTPPVTGHQSPVTEVKPPHCPHCGTPMPVLGLFQWAVGGWLILGVHCASPTCLKALHFEALPLQAIEQSQDQPPTKPRLIS